MKFTVDQTSFSDALRTVQGIVPANPTIQILSNAMLSAEDGLLTVYTTNVDVSIRSTIAAKIDEPGSTTLPVKHLTPIVSELGGGAIDVSVDANDTADIRSGASFFKIIGLTSKDFPKFEEPDTKACFTIGADVFREMLRKTSYAVSEDESRRIINGVLLSFKDGKLTIVATDSRRLALVEREVEFPPEIETEFVLPSRSVAELMRLLKDDGELKIYAAGGKKAVFQYGDTFLSTKLIEGTFPNYRQVIPQNFAERVEVVCGELLAAVRRVAMVAGKDKSIPTKLTFSGNELVVSMQSPDVGEAREVVAVKYGGKELSYAFNPEFVMAPLRNLDEGASVYIELSSGHGPATFKCDLPFLYVLMPLRV